MKIDTGKYKIVILLILVVFLTAIILGSLLFLKESEEQVSEPILYEELDVSLKTPPESEIYCSFLNQPFEEDLILKSEDDYKLFIKKIILNSYQDFTKSSIAKEERFANVDSNEFTNNCSEYLSIEEIDFERFFVVGNILKKEACNSFYDINFFPESFPNSKQLRVNSTTEIRSNCETIYAKGYLLAIPNKFIDYSIIF